jgi:hypothetical protein
MQARLRRTATRRTICAPPGLNGEINLESAEIFLPPTAWFVTTAMFVATAWFVVGLQVFRRG